MTFEEIMQKEHFCPNADQRKVIESTRNTVVSAGAGAGKTAVLSWRFLRLVMEEGVKPEEILTLTFTKKAASEMRERIYARLLQAQGSIPEDSLASFGRATISTLDSFCAQVVRSDSTSYGLPRDIVNLSEDDLDDLAERLAHRFLSDKDNEEETRLIASLFMPADLMERFFGKIAKLVSLAGNYDADRITRQFQTDLRDLYDRTRAQLEPMFNALGNLDLKGKFAEQYDRIYNCYINECFGEKDYFSLSGVRDPEVKEIVNEMKPLCGKDSGFVTLQNIVKNGNDVSILQIAVEKFANMLNLEKRKEGALTFKDVSDLAVSTLRDNLQLRDVYKRRFRYIMIDEFQDNNTSQRDLLFLLAERNDFKGTKGVVPTVDELDGGKLFFVGDEKQSIYKFRGADVSVFRALQRDICRNGCALSLHANYRSHAKLIKHFNEVFEKVLEGEGQDYEARFAPIQAGRGSNGNDPRIILSIFNKSDIEDEELDSGALEAEAIGDYCTRVLETDEFLVDGKRPSPSDIAIIFRSSGNQMNIEKALKRRKIDYQIAETRSLMIDAVSSDFYSFINYILYPDDTRSYVALLKSPFCGLCDKSIQNLILYNKDVEPIDEKRFQAFNSFLGVVREKAFRLTIPELLELLYIGGGYKAYLLSNDDRRSFVEHYDYLYSYAVQYDSEGRGLTDYARFLRNSLGKADKLPEASVLKRERSGVQIMTVHKSKGLEFKVVIFAGIGGTSQNDKDSYVFEYGGNLIASENKGVLKLLEKDRKDRELAELKRVMYVALTRAKDHLIMVGGYKLNKDGEVVSGEVLKWYLDAVGADVHDLTCTNEDVTIEDISKTPRKTWTAPENYDLDKLIPSGFVEFKSRATRMSITELKRLKKSNNSLDESIELRKYDIDSIIGTANLQDKFGTLCHLVLEHLLRFGSYDDVECHICESDSDNNLLLFQAREFADSFVRSSFFNDHVKGRKTLEELRFYTFDEEAPDVALEGVIDLLVLGEDYNLVVDYKSDSFRNPEEHRIQILSYVKVAEQIYGKRCYGTLYYLRDGSLGGFWDRDGNPVSPEAL